MPEVVKPPMVGDTVAFESEIFGYVEGELTKVYDPAGGDSFVTIVSRGEHISALLSELTVVKRGRGNE